MQAVATKNRYSLHSFEGSAFMSRGSRSFGSGGHFRKRRKGSLSFGISNYHQDTNEPWDVDRNESSIDKVNRIAFAIEKVTKLVQENMNT